MKDVKIYILEKLLAEKLQISKNSKHTLFPKTKKELERMIKSEIEKNGNKCDLNHIDTSEITDMTALFYKSEFNGDISNWVVSNVNYMTGLFYKSEFNGDISNWDVSNVEDMQYMFARSEFDQDISNWDVSNVTKISYMFKNSPLENNPPKWYKEK